MGLAQKITQTVESTVNQTRDHRLAGDTSMEEALLLEGSLSSSSVCMTSIESLSWFVSWIKKI